MNSASLGFVNITTQLGEVLPVRYDQFVFQLFKADSYDQQFNHAALGVCGEAGELADAIKKHIHYRKPLDRTNVIEELGDLRFYIQSVMNLMDITEQEVLQANANKLSERYIGLTYSDAAAIARADKINPSNNCNG